MFTIAVDESTSEIIARAQTISITSLKASFVTIKLFVCDGFREKKLVIFFYVRNNEAKRHAKHRSTMMMLSMLSMITNDRQTDKITSTRSLATKKTLIKKNIFSKNCSLFYRSSDIAVRIRRSISQRILDQSTTFE